MLHDAAFCRLHVPLLKCKQMNLFCSVFEVQLGGIFCNNSFTVVPLPSNFLLVPDGVLVGCCGVLGDPGLGVACGGVLGPSTFCVCPGSGVTKHNTDGDLLKASNSSSRGEVDLQSPSTCHVWSGTRNSKALCQRP